MVRQVNICLTLYVKGGFLLELEIARLCHGSNSAYVSFEDIRDDNYMKSTKIFEDMTSTLAAFHDDFFGSEK